MKKCRQNPPTFSEAHEGKNAETETMRYEELTKQEKEFFEMGAELKCDCHNPNTIQYFLTYCPESLCYLLDRLVY